MRKKIQTFSKKGTSFILVLALIIAYFVPIVPVIAASSTTTLSVTFRDGNIGRGKVQYSLNDGANWNDITANIENQNITVTGDNLRLKIVPNNNYSVDYTGIEIRQDKNAVDGLSTIGLESENGYAVPSSVHSIFLNQVEFRETQNNDP